MQRLDMIAWGVLCWNMILCVQAQSLFDRCTTTKDCLQTDLCDLNVKQCRRQFNQQCAENAECDSFHICDYQKKLCKRALHAECSNDDECFSTLVCDTHKNQCKYRLLASCPYQTKEWCANGLICDPVDRMCKRGAGSGCQEGECLSMHVCDDVENKCRVSLKGKCDLGGANVCASHTICDSMNQCSYSVGYPCNSTESTNPCVAGASCIEDVCQCLSTVAVESGSLCAPKEGVFGGSCDKQPCDENMDCENGVCNCTRGSYPLHFFACGQEETSLDASMLEADGGGGMRAFLDLGEESGNIVLLMGTIFGLSCLGLVCVLIWRHRMLKDPKKAHRA